MAKIINISDKLNLDKPSIEVNGKVYPVNDGMSTVIKFEELATVSTVESMVGAIELTLGKEAAEELGVRSWSLGNFRVLTTGILAAMQGIEYEEAELRFQQAEQRGNLV